MGRHGEHRHRRHQREGREEEEAESVQHLTIMMMLMMMIMIIMMMLMMMMMMIAHHGGELPVCLGCPRHLVFSDLVRDDSDLLHAEARLVSRVINIEGLLPRLCG